jgi:hypothetical protein
MVLGEKSSDTSGDHLVLNGLDVTRKLMDYRKKLVADHADWAESEDVDTWDSGTLRLRCHYFTLQE